MSSRSLSRCASIVASSAACPASVSVMSVPRRSVGSGVRAIRPAASRRSSRLVVPLEVSITVPVSSLGRSRYGGPLRRSVASTSYQPPSSPRAR